MGVDERGTQFVKEVGMQVYSKEYLMGEFDLIRSAPWLLSKEQERSYLEAHIVDYDEWETCDKAI